MILRVSRECDFFCSFRLSRKNSHSNLKLLKISQYNYLGDELNSRNSHNFQT